MMCLVWRNLISDKARFYVFYILHCKNKKLFQDKALLSLNNLFLFQIYLSMPFSLFQIIFMCVSDNFTLPEGWMLYRKTSLYLCYIAVFVLFFLLSSKYIPMINTYKQAAAPVKMFIICASVLFMVPKETSMERCKVKMDAAASA